MATYYIRTDGSDANTGTGPDVGSAWQTIRKALVAGSPIVGGDVIYIAPGTYRESSALTSTLAPTSTVQFIGDVSASQFSGVSAEAVKWSGHTNDDAAPVMANAQLQSLTNTIFDSIVFEFDPSFSTGNAAKPNMTFRKCTFNGASKNGTLFVSMTTDSALNWTFDRCIFINLYVYFAERGTTVMDIDLNILFVNCFFQCPFNAIYRTWSGSIGAGHKYGGYTVRNCTFVSCNYAFFHQTSNTNDLSTVYPSRLINCVFIACVNNAYLSAFGSTGLVLSYCRTTSGSSANITDGGNNIFAGIHGFEAYARLIQGLSKRHPWMPQIAGILDGDGTATGAPATDLFGYTRPGTPSVGALEINDLTAGGGLLVHPGMTGGIRG